MKSGKKAEPPGGYLAVGSRLLWFGQDGGDERIGVRQVGAETRRESRRKGKFRPFFVSNVRVNVRGVSQRPVGGPSDRFYGQKERKCERPVGCCCRRHARRPCDGRRHRLVWAAFRNRLPRHLRPKNPVTSLKNPSRSLKSLESDLRQRQPPTREQKRPQKSRKIVHFRDFFSGLNEAERS